MGLIGLIDVDGHHFPNLALMRIAAYHKSIGDTVEWWWSDLVHYDIVYKSKVFSDAYSRDVPDPLNCEKVIRGGSGYCITLDDSGIERFDVAKNNVLPDDMEDMYPDYSIYPWNSEAIAMTSRGCPRGCAFCHVRYKEGLNAHKVADLDRFWRGQKTIQVCDPNITAVPEKRDLFAQYLDASNAGARIEFNQGLDIRLLDDADIEDLRRMRLKRVHLAWDNPADRLGEKFTALAEAFNLKPSSHGNLMTVYVLTNYGNYTAEEHIQRALDRIYFLRDLGFAPYVMVYNKPSAPMEIRKLQRWVNNKYIFYKVKRFEDYQR